MFSSLPILMGDIAHLLQRADGSRHRMNSFKCNYLRNCLVNLNITTFTAKLVVSQRERFPRLRTINMN